jgi:hypothetical protein
MAYQKDRDAIQDAQWQAKFDDEDAKWQAEFDEEKRQYAADEQKANYNNLANLITSYGYQPSAEELKAAGMSDKQAQSMLDGYNKSQVAATSGGGVGSKTGTKYKDLDVGSSAYNGIVTGIKKATTLDELNAITSEYIALGYNPDQIYAMMTQKLTELQKGSEPIDTGVDLNSNKVTTNQVYEDPREQAKKNNKYNGVNGKFQNMTIK